MILQNIQFATVQDIYYFIFIQFEPRNYTCTAPPITYDKCFMLPCQQPMFLWLSTCNLKEIPVTIAMCNSRLSPIFDHKAHDDTAKISTLQSVLTDQTEAPATWKHKCVNYTWHICCIHNTGKLPREPAFLTLLTFSKKFKLFIDGYIHIAQSSELVLITMSVNTSRKKTWPVN